MPNEHPVKIEPSNLVHLIVWHAAETGNALTPLRLVKFLYLADLYYARAHRGETLTGWPWAFVHYGPYCSEAMDTIQEAVRRRLVEAKP